VCRRCTLTARVCNSNTPGIKTKNRTNAPNTRPTHTAADLLVELGEGVVALVRVPHAAVGVLEPLGPVHQLQPVRARLVGERMRAPHHRAFSRRLELVLLALLEALHQLRGHDRVGAADEGKGLAAHALGALHALLLLRLVRAGRGARGAHAQDVARIRHPCCLRCCSRCWLCLVLRYYGTAAAGPAIDIDQARVLLLADRLLCSAAPAPPERGHSCCCSTPLRETATAIRIRQVEFVEVVGCARSPWALLVVLACCRKRW